jgi:hypothetical protein
MHQAKSRCFSWSGNAASAAKPCAGGTLKTVELEHLVFRGEPAVGAGVGEVVQRAARVSFSGAQIERTRAVAGMLEQIGAERVEREVEGDLEVLGEMGARDLQAMRLEIVDERLAEAAFLVQRLFGAGGGAGDFCVGVIILRAGGESVVVVPSLGFAIFDLGHAADRGPLDEALIQAEFSVVADGDDDAGAGAVLVAEDGEAIDRLVDFGAPLLDLLRFSRKFVSPIVAVDVFKLAETAFDALDFGGKISRHLCRLRPHARVLSEGAVFEIEERFGPFP